MFADERHHRDANGPPTNSFPRVPGQGRSSPATWLVRSFAESVGLSRKGVVSHDASPTFWVGEIGAQIKPRPIKSMFANTAETKETINSFLVS